MFLLSSCRRSLPARWPRRSPRAAPRARLWLEQLEDRMVPSWTTAAPLPLQRHEAEGAAVNGQMYVFGGYIDDHDTTARVDKYDPGTDTWTQLSDMPLPIADAGTAVDGQTIYLAGGWWGPVPSVITNRLLKYDVPTDTWSDGPPLPDTRGAGGLVLLGRELHFFGGLDNVEGFGTDRGEHWVMNLDDGTGWRSAAPLPNPRNHLGYTALNGEAYAIGGQHLGDHDTGVQDEVDAYDPAADTWTQVASLPIPTGHIHHSTVVLNGQIITVGGLTNGNTAITDVRSYNPDTNSWTALTPLPEERYSAAAQQINGQIIVTGGSATIDVSTTTTWIGTFPAASSLVVGGFSSPTTAGSAGTFTVTATDSFGNTAAGYQGTVHFTSSDPQADLPADYTFTAADHGVHSFRATLTTAGTQSLTATDTVTASITGTQAGIVVNPAAAVTLSVSGYPSPATTGVGAYVLVQALDPYGNVDINYTGTVHLTSSDPQAYLDPDRMFTVADAGQYSFYVVLNTAGTSSITATDTATPSITGMEDGIFVTNPT